MDFLPPFGGGGGADRRFPTSEEITNGFPCGPADKALFTGLFYGIYSELGNLLAGSDIEPSNADLYQVMQAVRSQRLNWIAASEVTGTPNAIILTPAFPVAAYKAGQVFRFPFKYTNTGPTTVAISGLPAKEVVTPDYLPLEAYHFLENTVGEIIYDGTRFWARPVLSWSLIDLRIRLATGKAVPGEMRIYTSSTTWTKPANLNYIRVRMQAPGASGGISSGNGGPTSYYWGGAGGNGGYVEAYYNAADLSASHPVTIGAGGVARLASGGVQTGANGGDCVFHTLYAQGGFGGGGASNGPGNFGESGIATVSSPAKGFGVQGARGGPGDYFGVPSGTPLGLFGRGGNGGKAGVSAGDYVNGGAGLSGIVIIEEFLLP